MIFDLAWRRRDRAAQQCPPLGAGPLPAIGPGCHKYLPGGERRQLSAERGKAATTVLPPSVAVVAVRPIFGQYANTRFPSDRPASVRYRPGLDRGGGHVFVRMRGNIRGRAGCGLEGV